MKIFITGATGYIGNAVACAFRRAGNLVYGLTRGESGARSLQQSEIFPIVGNISEPSTFLSIAEQADVLIHCSVEYTAEAVARDAQAIDALLLASSKGSRLKTLIYTSGVWVYGNTEGKTCDENSPLSPIPKVAWRPDHEQRVLNGASSALNCIVLRPGCVYGGAGGLTPLWFSPAAKEKPIPLIEKGENRWAMVHRDDLAQAYLLAVEKGIPSTVLNLTDRSRLTTRTMVEAIAQAAGISGQTESISYQEAVAQYGELAQGLALDQSVSSSKAETLLGWRPRHQSFAEEALLYFNAWKMKNC